MTPNTNNVEFKSQWMDDRLRSKSNAASELKKIADHALISQTEKLAREEREILVQILHHLHEIYRRRLFSALGYTSIYDFAVRKLGYSADAAYRRIEAMKVLHELPEIEEKLSSGKITLTHIGVAQSFFRQEVKATQSRNSEDTQKAKGPSHEELSKQDELLNGEIELSHRSNESSLLLSHSHESLSEIQGFSKNDQIQFYEKLENTSVREAQRIALSLSTVPHQAKPDKIKPVTEDRIEIKFEASADLQSKIEKLKGLLAHKHPRLSLGELFDKLCDLGLQEWDPGKPRRKVQKSLVDRKVQKSSVTQVTPPKSQKMNMKNQKTSVSKRKSDGEADLTFDETAGNKEVLSDSSDKAQRDSSDNTFGDQSGASPAEMRREVWRKAQNKCEICESTFALEIDHLIPRSHGGLNTLENLRLLCRSCNQRAGIEKLGQSKMDLYIN